MVLEEGELELPGGGKVVMAPNRPQTGTGPWPRPPTDRHWSTAWGPLIYRDQPGMADAGLQWSKLEQCNFARTSTRAGQL